MMDFLEACRKYNKIVQSMRDAAAAGQWDRMLEIDRTARPYVEVLIQQSPAHQGQTVDDETRVLLAEIVAYQGEIAKLIGARQMDLKAELVSGATAQKLGKLYGV